MTTRKKSRTLVNVYTVSTAVIAVSCTAQLIARWPIEWFAPALIIALLLVDLGFTLAELRRRKKENVSPAPAIIRNPRLIELALAEAHLAGLRAAYKAGRTSGHPEDALWDIEDAEQRVARLRAGSD